MADIVKVDEQRWEVAQDWERKHWNEAQRLRSRYGKNVAWKLLSPVLPSKFRGDDWNHWWKEQFANYDFLPNIIENGIELGCGPYTNVRLMLDGREFRHLVLSDPLIRDYVKFKLTFVSEMYKSARCVLDGHPIEECPFKSNYFDLVVMINVLDHVRDAELCMANAVDLVRSDGILIIGQDLTDHVDMMQSGVRNDIGHPIKVGHKWMNEFVEGRFENLLYRILPRESGRNPEAHYGTYIFAGRKLI